MRVDTLLSDGVPIVSCLEITETPWERMRGLLGRRSLPRGHGMWIWPCGSVHTFFMRFRLDLVFMNREGVVVRLVRNVVPFRAVFGGMSCRGVLEVEAGWLTGAAVAEGRRLRFGSEGAPGGGKRPPTH